jgi:hypothetical protein
MTGERVDRAEFEERIPRQPCIAWVLDDLPPLTAAPWKVLVVIAKHADPDGTNAWPSIATIARLAQVVERTVRRALVELERLGLLVVIPNGGGTPSMREDRRPNAYVVARPGMRHGRAQAPTRRYELPQQEDSPSIHARARESDREDTTSRAGGLECPPTIPEHSSDYPETTPAPLRKSDPVLEMTESLERLRAIREEQGV